MAKGKKTGGKNFEPGNKLGQGAASHNQELKALRRMTQAQVAEIFQVILDGDSDKLADIKESKDSTTLQKMVCGVALKAVAGDYNALNAILDRIVGKVKDTVQLTGDLNHDVTFASASQVKAILTKLNDEF